MDDHVQLMPDGMPLHLVHFIYQSPAGVIEQQGERLAEGEDTWKIACIPGQREIHANVNRPMPMPRSEEPRAVTCPQCKETQVFKDCLARQQQVLVRHRRHR